MAMYNIYGHSFSNMTTAPSVQKTPATSFYAQEATDTDTPPSPSPSQSQRKSTLTSGYLVFVCLCVAVGKHYSERDYSSLLTLAGGFQALALVLLRINMEYLQSVAGVSAKTILLATAASMFRLCSTTWLSGYVPTDATGEWVYQATDVVSFLIGLSLLHTVYRRYSDTYDYEKDDRSPTVIHLFMCAVFLATIAHGDLNDRPIFDTVWFIGFYSDCIAVFPQLCFLWHSVRSKDDKAITGHYVWPWLVKVGLSYAFFFYAFTELQAEDCPSCVNYVGYAVVTMHSLQLAFVIGIGALKLDKSIPVGKEDPLVAEKLGLSLISEIIPPTEVSAKKGMEVELSARRPDPELGETRAEEDGI